MRTSPGSLRMIVLLGALSLGGGCATTNAAVGGRVGALFRVDSGEPVLLATPELAGGTTLPLGEDAPGQGRFFSAMAGYSFDLGFEGGTGFTGGSYPFVDVAVGSGAAGLHLRVGAGAAFDVPTGIRGLVTLSAGAIWRPEAAAAPRSVVTFDVVARRPFRGSCTMTGDGPECPPDQAWQLGLAVGYAAVFEWVE